LTIDIEFQIVLGELEFFVIRFLGLGADDSDRFE
jgi:hypothetical protein